MKLGVRVEGREFTVEITDVTVRPIRATVNGKTFEVWPESSGARPSQPREPQPLAHPDPLPA